MPRDGSNIYHRPVGTDAVTDTTIESTKYNSNVADVEQDLNLPRPIVAGGTGANNAHDAMIALSGEIASQVVTNYDTFPFVAGSFISTPGATSAPDSTNFFSGICYMQNSGAIILEARQHNAGLVGPLYVREKWSTWGVWKQQAGSTADLDAAYVNVAGDTMSNSLTMAGGNVIMAGGGRVAFNDGSGAQWGSGTAAIIGSSAGNYQSFYTNSASRMNIGDTGVGIAPTTASTSPTTGALTVAGGVGVGNNLFVGGVNADISISGSNASRLLFNGGTANFWISQNYDVSNTFVIKGPSGGVVNINAAGNVNIQTTTASYSPTTGALTVAGGVGIAGAVITALYAIFQNHANLSPNYGITVGLAQAKNVAGNSGISIQSNDDGAGRLDGWMYLYSDPVATKRRLAIQCIENGIAWRNITLGEDQNSLVGIGVQSPIARLHVWAGTNENFHFVDAGSGVGALRMMNDAANAYTPFRLMSSANTIDAPTAFTSAVASTSPTTGALTVAGGVGIGGQVNISPSGVASSGFTVALNVSFHGSAMYGIGFRPGVDNTTIQQFVNAAGVGVGTIAETATGVAYNVTSDGRLKEDLKSFDAGNIVDNTNVYDFAWKSTGERSYGIIAQQAVDVYPNAVTYQKENDWYGIDYSKYVPVLLQELKALRARVAQLEGAAARPA